MADFEAKSRAGGMSTESALSGLSSPKSFRLNEQTVLATLAHAAGRPAIAEVVRSQAMPLYVLEEILDQLEFPVAFK